DLEPVAGTACRGLRQGRTGDGRGAARNPESLPQGRHSSGPSLRNMRICGQGDRLGVQHDHGFQRRAPACRGGEREREGVSRADGRQGGDYGKQGRLLMPHVLVAGRLHPSGIALLRGAPEVTYDYVEEVSEASYAPLIGKADGLVIRTQPLSSRTVEQASNLK